ncbi:facilitated trehalose transporter Tret1-2 homolog isoform X2 [Chelonus insularis]|uniref:facilitated trehalose transporter Tret1-2 homolog isoform X2 n=1 Tax=Chelonus insularis TaxID=460826 RepID=UPI00158F1859|nr:facilitated trehalose transporter Tret1-2 homolog isoform X2 [Chelonus insularis]
MLEVISTIEENFDTPMDLERSVHQKYYPWLPSLGKPSTASCNISEDCASNTTLLTNASPFNSQQALVSDKKKPTVTKSSKNNNHSGATSYYAENLKHENDLRYSQILRTNNRNITIVDLKQLEPLVMDDPMTLEEGDILIGLQEQKNVQDISKTKECQKVFPEPEFRRFNTKKILPVHLTNIMSQVLAALSVSLGSLVVGYSSGYTSPALPSMNNTEIWNLYLTSEMESWIGSVMPLSAIFGGIAGGPLIEYLGRRNTIMLTALPFIAAGLVIGMAVNSWIIIVGRILSGFAVGIASLSLPVYLGETIQAEVRGTLGLLPTAFGNIGILTAFIAGEYLNWYKLAYLGACLPIPFFLLMLLIPETPRWFISKGKTKKARKSLQWLRGKNADISEELASVEKAHVDSEKNSLSNPIKELFQSHYIKPLSISLGLMLFQQLSGINAVIFYSKKIFATAGSSISDGLCSIIIGCVNFISTFIATALIDRLGRKLLLYISSVAMIVTLALLGIFFYLYEHKYDTSSYGWIPLTTLIIYVLGFSLGFGPIPWLMMGEILPAKVRGQAASIVTGFNWICTFIVTKTFLSIANVIGQAAVFWLYCGICIIGLIFVIVFVPETRGRSLEDIEKRLTGPVRRMSAIANIKPMPTAC